MGTIERMYWKKHPKNAPSFLRPRPPAFTAPTKKVAHLWGFALHYLRCPQPNRHHAGSLTSTKGLERLRGPKTRKDMWKNAHVWKTVGQIPIIFDITDFFRLHLQFFRGKIAGVGSRIYVDVNETSKDSPMITDPMEFEHSLVGMFNAGSSWCFAFQTSQNLKIFDLNLREPRLISHRCWCFFWFPHEKTYDVKRQRREV